LEINVEVFSLYIKKKFRYMKVNFSKESINTQKCIELLRKVFPYL
jgi:hypothetical protein